MLTQRCSVFRLRSKKLGPGHAAPLRGTFLYSNRFPRRFYTSPFFLYQGGGSVKPELWLLPVLKNIRFFLYCHCVYDIYIVKHE